jgi:hypothetical protein
VVAKPQENRNNIAPHLLRPFTNQPNWAKMSAQKVGRHWRFHRATLINWIAGKNHPNE